MRGVKVIGNSITLLKDPEYIQKVKETIEDVKRTYSVNPNDLNVNEDIEFNINDQLFLETLMMLIRGMTIKYSSEKKRRTVETELRLENEIKSLENEINANFTNIEEEKIRDLITKKEQLSNIRKKNRRGYVKIEMQISRSRR